MAGVEILIAEDSPTQREHLRMILEERGFSVRAAVDGKKALAATKERMPTLLISDVNMPEMDGYELCKTIKNDPTLRSLPVVLVTDLTGTTAILRGLESGADNFFTKPYDEEHLVARLDYILANRRIRPQDNLQMGIEVTMAGQRHFITAERQQILDLLISSYEEAVHLSEQLRKQQLALERAYQTTQALFNAADALNRCRSQSEVEECLLEQAVSLPGVAGGWLLLGKAPQSMRLAAVRGIASAQTSPNPAELQCECLTRLRGVDTALAGVVASCGWLTSLGSGPGSHATIPLYAQGQTIGVLNILRDGQVADASQLDMLAALGNLAATALSRAQLNDELEQRVEARTAALLDSEERFRDFAESASDWFWETDSKLRYTAFLERGSKSLGLASNDMAGRSRMETIPRVLQPEVYDQHQKDLDERRPFRDLVLQLRRADGEIIQVKTNGKPFFAVDGSFLGYRGTGRDITQEVIAERALRESEERLASLAVNIPGVLFQRTEDPDGNTRFPYVSPRISDVLGVRPDEIRSNPDFLAKLMAPEFADALSKGLERAVTTGSAVEVEGQATNRSGESKWLRARFKVRADGNGQKTWDGMLLDATNEQQLKQRQRALENQLSQAQKMEAIGNLTGGMAHDFNNILTIILGNLEGLSESGQLPDSLKDMATEGMEACMRAAELTRQLLAFARRQPLEPKLFNVNDAVTSMAKLLSRTLGEHVKIKVNTGSGVWPVLVDPAQLESAIANLSVNARDAMPDGGTITMSTRNMVIDADHVHFFPDAAPGDYACIEVADTGTGIPPEIISRIFEPFFTTKEPGKGTGLGLAMIFGFVKQSGGHIQAYSEVGHGTAMRLYLPRCKDGSEEGTASDLEDETPGAIANEWILVVEDNDKIRRQVAAKLANLGYGVVEAANGPEALSVLSKGEPIDLLFTDVVMPGGLNGYELYQQALAMRSGLRVLFTSGFSGPATGKAGALSSNHALLTKPYRNRDLARKIRQLLDRAPPAS